MPDGGAEPHDGFVPKEHRQCLIVQVNERCVRRTRCPASRECASYFLFQPPPPRVELLSSSSQPCHPPPAPPGSQEYCNHGTLLDAVDRGWLRTKRELHAPVDLTALLLTARVHASAAWGLGRLLTLMPAVLGGTALGGAASPDHCGTL